MLPLIPTITTRQFSIAFPADTIKQSNRMESAVAQLIVLLGPKPEEEQTFIELEQL